MSAQISASVVTYNNQRQVIRLLQSLSENYDLAVGGDSGGIDFYLIDNASSDDTVELVKQEYPWVQVLTNEQNVGFGAAHNRVLPQLESKYHLVINPDIVLIEDAITPPVAFMEEHPEVVMVTPRILNLDGSEQKLPKLRPRFKYVVARRFEQHLAWAQRLCREYTRADERFDQPTVIENCTGSFFIIRTEIFRELGGFDPRFFLYFEDNDLSVRVQEYGDIVFYPETQVMHGYQRAAMKSPRALWLQIQSMFRFFAKHGW